MMSTDTPTYNFVAILLHWLIAVLVVAMFFFGLYAHEQVEALRAGNAELATVVALFNWHKTIGLVVLVLAVLRLVWRLTHKPPPLSPEVPVLERMLARLAHAAFYVLIIGIPFVGWLMISAAESPSYFLNDTALPIPEIWGDDREFRETLGDVHKYAAYGIMALLVLHVAAALKHHYRDGADTLARMVPFIRPRGRQNR